MDRTLTVKESNMERLAHSVYDACAMITEQRNEIVRHHRDFERISRIAETWADGLIPSDKALNAIRNIVG